MVIMYSVSSVYSNNCLCFIFLPTGLLSSDKSSPFYSTHLDLKAAEGLVNNSDVIFREAISKDSKQLGKTDIEYLVSLENNASGYWQSKQLCGRTMAVKHIKNLCLKKGKLVFVTGGPSVGKSLIIRKLALDIDSTAKDIGCIKVDGRKSMDFPSAMIEAARDRFVEAAGVAVNTSIKIDNKGTDLVVPSENVIEAVESVSHPSGKSHYVLILDEANRFLESDDKHKDDTKRLFHALVAQTKQELNMTALLVSADHDMPFRLHHNLGLTTSHITNTVVIGEATPQEVFAMLQGLRVGPNLSHALVNMHGGHVYQICELLESLRGRYELNMQIDLQLNSASFIRHAVFAWTNPDGIYKGDYKDIERVLKEVARTGFYPITLADVKIAEVLTKEHVCDYLPEHAVEFHVPPDLRKNNRAGLVPTTQLTRIIIPRTLSNIHQVRLYVCIIPFVSLSILLTYYQHIAYCVRIRSIGAQACKFY